MNLKDIKRVHFIGIGGIGISYLAHYFLRAGATVSGSDLAQTPTTDQLAAKGAAVYKGHSADVITPDIELVVYTDAIPQDNPELVKAKELKIPTHNNFEMVGMIAQGHTTIAIAGNKGKTTTTAMLATMLENAGCDPTAMVGSIVNEWKCNFRGGESPYLVVEADEFKEHFLHIPATVAVITNMAADHLDYFGSVDKLIAAFQKFVNKLPNKGLLVVNADDEMTKQLRWPNCQVLTFGMKTTADVMATKRDLGRGKQAFDITYRGQSLGRWILPAPGRYNVYNALAAITVAVSLGVDVKKLHQSLMHFKGTWRRFEVLGRYKYATMISDYAHNPVSVHSVLEAAQDFYPGQRLVAVFQAHTRHRTKSLFTDFVASFDPADVVLIPDIYAVAGRETVSEQEMNAGILVDAIKARDAKRDRQRIVMATGDLAQTKTAIDKILQPDDVILMIGAGDIYQLAEGMISNTL